MKISEIVSRVFDPLRLVGPVVFAIVIFNVGLTFNQLIILVPTIAIVGVIAPLLTFFLLRKKGHIKDTDITKREERYLFFGFLTICFLLSLILIFIFGNKLLFVLNLTLLAVTAATWLLNFKFKISGHLAWDSLAIFIVNFLFQWQFIWLFLLIPVIGYARIDLKKHTLFQVSTGTLVGLLIPYLVLNFFGLI